MTACWYVMQTQNFPHSYKVHHAAGYYKGIWTIAQNDNMPRNYFGNYVDAKKEANRRNQRDYPK